MKKIVVLVLLVCFLSSINLNAQNDDGEELQDDFNWSKDISEITKAVKSLLEENIKLKTVVNSHLAQLNSLKEQIQSLQNEKDSLINKLDSVDIKLSTNSKIKEMQGSIKQLMDNNKKLAKDLSFSESERKVLAESSKDLISRLKSAESMSDDFKQQLQILKDSYEQFKENTQELEAQLKANRR